MGNDIYESGKLCRYGKIPGLEKPVSRMIFGTAIGLMIEGKNADELLDAAFAKGIHTFVQQEAMDGQKNHLAAG